MPTKRDHLGCTVNHGEINSTDFTISPPGLRDPRDVRKRNTRFSPPTCSTCDAVQPHKSDEFPFKAQLNLSQRLSQRLIISQRQLNYVAGISAPPLFAGSDSERLSLTAASLNTVFCRISPNVGPMPRCSCGHSRRAARHYDSCSPEVP